LNGTRIENVMATYLFKCYICGRVFEKRIPINDEKAHVTCPNGHQQVRRVYTPPHIIFKGSGFYINDSKSKLDIKNVKNEKIKE
jgi:putative FmdB family regulatory protein